MPWSTAVATMVLIASLLAGTGTVSTQKPDAVALQEGDSLVVPNHRSVAKGTLRALIREAGLTVQEFRDAL